jgi:PhnB protein
MAKPIPDGFPILTPHLVVNDADKAIAFYKKAFGATEAVCLRTPEGKVMHAELDAYGSRFMLAGASPEWNCFGPDHYKGTGVSMHFYVKDCDQAFKKAVDAGAKVQQPLEDMFWGDRYGMVVDPFGHQWAFATHKKDLTDEQVRKAGEAWMKGMAQAKKHAAAA